MPKFRFRLKEIMKEKGVKHKPLAQELGISPNTLKAYRNNWILRPDLEIMAKLCVYFGIEIGELLILDADNSSAESDDDDEEPDAE